MCVCLLKKVNILLLARSEKILFGFGCCNILLESPLADFYSSLSFFFYLFASLLPFCVRGKMQPFHLPKSTGCESINDAISKTKDAIDASVNWRCFILFNDACKSLVGLFTVYFLSLSLFLAFSLYCDSRIHKFYPWRKKQEPNTLFNGSSWIWQWKMKKYSIVITLLPRLNCSFDIWQERLDKFASKLVLFDEIHEGRHNQLTSWQVTGDTDFSLWRWFNLPDDVFMFSSSRFTSSFLFINCQIR